MNRDRGGLGVWLGAEPANDSPVFLTPQLGKFTGLRTALILGGDK